MAGDVAAVLQNGNLFLSEAAGQAGKDNSVIIARQSNNLVRVSGNITSDGTVSKINGLAYEDFRVTGSLNVSFGAGNDTVVIGGENTPSMSPSFTAVNIDVSAPQQQNATATASSSTTSAIAKAAVVTPPTGTTPIAPDNDSVVVWGMNVAGSASITTGIGNDYVYMTQATIGGSLSINTGSGNDNVDLEQMGLVSGTVTVQMNSQSNESDHVMFNGVYAKGNIQVNTGAGADFVTIETTTGFANVGVNTGAGNDSVTLYSVHAVDQIMAQLGDGNDSLTADYLYTNLVDLDGGSGTNSLTIGKDLYRSTSSAMPTLEEIGWTFINGKYVPPQNASNL